MRYSRQIVIERIGEKGQEKLANSSVMVVGAGGLASPALTYLAMAGVGRIGLIDSDVVALSNLNRQFLHQEKDVGRAKAASAKETLVGLNSEIEIAAYEELLTDQNAQNIFATYDIVVGAVDSFTSRAIINRACVALGLPYVDGGISEFSGTISFIHTPLTACLRCIFPENSVKKKDTGVLGVSPGVVGAIEANIALMYLLGLPCPLENKVLVYDGLRLSMDFIAIRRDENCPVCRKR